MAGYWEKVAAIVGTHSSEECRNQYTSQGTSQSPAKGAKIPRKEKAEAPKNPGTEKSPFWVKNVGRSTQQLPVSM